MKRRQAIGGAVVAVVLAAFFVWGWTTLPPRPRNDGDGPITAGSQHVVHVGVDGRQVVCIVLMSGQVAEAITCDWSSS